MRLLLHCARCAALIGLLNAPGPAVGQFLPGPATCPTIPFSMPYDVSGLHVWEVTPALPVSQGFRRVLGSCGDIQTLIDGDWPEDASITPPHKYQIQLALESVTIDGAEATFSYAGTLTFDTTNDGECDYRDACALGYLRAFSFPTWRGKELQVHKGTLNMVWRFNSSGTWTLVTSGTEFLSDERIAEPDFCSRYDNGSIIRLFRNLGTTDECRWTMRNVPIPPSEFPPCVDASDFLNAQNPAICSGNSPLDRQGPNGYSFNRERLPIFPGGKFSLDAPKGDIQVRIDSNQDEMTPSGVNVERARLKLSRQSAYIRNQDPGESNEDYAAYLATVPLAGNPMEVTLDASAIGMQTFSDLVTFDLATTANTKTYVPVYYTLQILEAESARLPILGETENTTVFFTNEIRRNLRASETPTTLVINLSSFDQIIRKEALVLALTTLGPEQYQPIEEAVQQYLNQVKVTRTPQELEAIDRAILAEQLTRDSVRFAEQQIDVLLMGFQSFVDDLIDGLGGENKALAEQRDKLNNLTGALEFGALQSRGWKGFVSGDSGTAGEMLSHIGELVGANDDLGVSLMAGVLKKGVDTAYGLMRQALVSAQVADETSLLLADFIKAQFDSALAFAIAQSFGGSKPTSKFIVAQIIQATKASLVDSVAPYSFTALTRSRLEASRQLMEGWNTDDRLQFDADRRAFRQLDNEMAQAVFVTSNGTTAYSTAIADAFGGFGAEVIGLLGPFGRATKKVMDGVKFLSNYLTFSVPFVTTYGVIAGPELDLDLSLAMPFGDATVRLGLLERGIRAAYGGAALPAVPKASAVRKAQFAASKGLSVSAGYLNNAVNAQRDALFTALDAVSAALADDRIIDAAAATGQTDGSALIDALPGFRDAVEHAVQYQQGAISGDDSVFERLSDVIERNANLVLTYADVVSRLQQVYFSVLNLDYAGPASAQYLAERDWALAGLAAMRTDVQNLAARATGSLTQLPDMPLTPAVAVSRLEIESTTTGEETIAQASETFTIRATVRNLGADPANQLSAVLSTISVGDTVSIVGAAIQSPAGSMLTANDGVDGSGADEAVLLWQIAYAGDPGIEQRAVLSVDLKENGAAPGSFRPYAASAILRPDISATDGDLDGMPTAWEAANGLDPLLDDAAGDADNDGLINSEEFNAGANPQIGDSDGDNLSDGEEAIAGSDGFVTNPVVADSDGDGTNDDIDGSPLDASTTAAPPPGSLPGEPVVAIGNSMVVMNATTRVAMVAVTNSGEGTLNWTAIPDNPALVSVSPTAPDIRSADGAVFLTVPPNVSIGAETLQTSVTVLDVAGTTKDFQVITVVLGTPVDTLFADGFETP